MTAASGAPEARVQQALARVFGSDAVSEPRADTPLSAYGNVDIAWVMVAAALEQATDGRIILSDDDVAGVQTFGDLVEAVQAAQTPQVVGASGNVGKGGVA